MALPAETRPAEFASLWDLAGQWSLARRIRHVDGRENSFSGKAVFTRSGSRLIQEESGLLRLDDQALEARQRLVWKQDGPMLKVHFADMQPFHEIPIGVTDPEAVHDCPPDRYHVTYDFAQWPVWGSVWTVTGPRKDYIMNSTYTPA
ncbi:MAG: trigger factor [Boseongicola sp. SB0673_bin_14]|nr:trigger factor [Boseongicola sp. SB0667_bin_21]MYI68131.1 trigger factor [Boseongicola sp. SB0673_bin_14]